MIARVMVLVRSSADNDPKMVRYDQISALLAGIFWGEMEHFPTWGVSGSCDPLFTTDHIPAVFRPIAMIRFFIIQCLLFPTDHPFSPKSTAHNLWFFPLIMHNFLFLIYVIKLEFFDPEKKTPSKLNWASGRLSAVSTLFRIIIWMSFGWVCYRIWI